MQDLLSKKMHFFLLFFNIEEKILEKRHI